MDKRVDGQNIYFLVGHTRSNIFANNAGLFQGKGVIGPAAGVQEYGHKIQNLNDKGAVKLRTIPNSNLNDRKRAVLRIHKENLQMVTRLANLKAK